MRNMIRLQLVCIFALFAGLTFGYDVGDYSYSYNLSTKEGTITAYRGSASNLSIPESFSVAETYKDEDDGETHTRHHTITVTGIGSSAFAKKTFITSVAFHNKLKTIGSSAFSGCTGLTSVRTPASLHTLGGGAFQDCTGLEEIVVDGTDLDLYDQSSIFFGCSSLRRVVFGDGVIRLYKWSTTNWYSGTFKGCGNLEYVSVGSGVTEIPPYFLAKCGSSSRKMAVSFAAPITKVNDNALGNSNITNLTISLSSCAVGGGAFASCPAVTFGNIDFGEVASIDYSAFENCVNLVGALDLSAVSKIGNSAFKGCTGIDSVKFSDGLTDIGSSAFSGCTKASLFAFRSAPPSVGSSAFKNVMSGAVGTYTAEHTTEWEAVIDSKGYWNGLKMKPAYYTVIYDANNGSGARSTATVEWGVPTAAGVGTFTWEAHYFMGWPLKFRGEAYLMLMMFSPSRKMVTSQPSMGNGLHLSLC